MTSGFETILIIDDDETISEILEAILEDDYDLSLADSAMKGLALARSEAPDLILLDIAMPDLDGYEVCRLLKSDVLTNYIPIIFITAKSSAEDETRGLEAGAVDYITKPINPSIVKARVRNHMELKKQRDFLKKLSFTDVLTNLPNRRWFDMWLDREWRRCWRTEKPLSLIMVDIDYFVSYNEEYGDLAGDECIRGVAEHLSQVPRRGGDLLGRFSGQKFAVILPDTPWESLDMLCEKFREVVEQAGIIHDHSTVSNVVTVSVGASAFVPHKDLEPSMLLNKADQMLTMAKKEGHNRVCIDKPNEAWAKRPT